MVSRIREWPTNMYDEERSSRPSVQTYEDVQYVDYKLRFYRRFTISALTDKFLLVGRTTTLKIVMEKLHKLCTRWVPKILTGEHKEQKMSSRRWLLDSYRQCGADLFATLLYWATRYAYPTTRPKPNSQCSSIIQLHQTERIQAISLHDVQK